MEHVRQTGHALLYEAVGLAGTAVESAFNTPKIVEALDPWRLPGIDDREYSRTQDVVTEEKTPESDPQPIIGGTEVLFFAMIGLAGYLLLT